MKISVLGAGAVGCMIAGLIRSNDPSVEVWLYGRGDHLIAMKERGAVSLRGVCGNHDVPVHVCDSLADIQGSDLILFTVKSSATEDLIHAAAPYLGNATVVSLQNGMNQRVLAQVLEPSQFLVGMTATNMSIVCPGVVELHLAAPTLLGHAATTRSATTFKDSSYRHPSLDILSRSGLPMIGHCPIEQVQYNKIAVNALGYLSALSQSNFAIDCLLDKRWREVIAIPMLRESARVVRAAGIKIIHVPGPSDVLRLQQSLQLLRFPVVRWPIAQLIRRRGTPRLIYSVEQDLLRGRATEMPFVNGEIVRLAEQHGVAAPLHRLSLTLVGELESEPTPRFFTKEQVIRRFADSSSFNSP